MQKGFGTCPKKRKKALGIEMSIADMFEPKARPFRGMP